MKSEREPLKRNPIKHVVPGARVVLAAALGVAACQEAVTAPGACPEYCPPESVQLVDTVLVEAIRADSTFVGYVTPWEAAGLQLVNDPAGTGAVTASRAVMRFFAFPERLLLNAADTITAPVSSIDSFSVSISVQARAAEATGLELVLYRLPVTVDSTATFGDLDPFFVDSARIAVVPVPDTLQTGTLKAVVPESAFPTFTADGPRAAIGIELRSTTGAFVNLGTLESNQGAELTRFVQVDSAGTAVPRKDARVPELDTFVAPPLPAAGAGVLRIGGVPAARALMRVTLPAAARDSAAIVRATIQLVPTEPVLGAPGDSIRILAQAVTANFGAKSPLLIVPIDSVEIRSTVAAVGQADTIRVDVTEILRAWLVNKDLPHLLVLRAVPEGSRLSEVRAGSSAFTAARPTLHITFVPSAEPGGS